ncbi:hypothetical protein M7784_16395 [Desulfovibrio aminophilus]|nr:hypothetical protein [Desulfovibrio aminophilus]MCM0756815.1 hypothetical protein [Desulfovibrio aminophilus]
MQQAWIASALEWAGFFGITVGIILVIKHFTLDTRLGDMARHATIRWVRLGAYVLLLVLGLVAQHLARVLTGGPS